MEKIYDVAIIGCGPGGMTAAIYAKRLGLNTIIFEGKEIGGAMATAHVIENYPGFLRINGKELAEKMFEQVKKVGATFIPESVIGILKSETFEITTDRKNIFKAKSIILATGSEYKKLGIIGEEKFLGKGVSYCPTCDGPLFKGKKVAVIGGGDTAVTGAIYLSEICDLVYLIHRRNEFKAENANVENLNKKVKEGKIILFLQHIPIEIIGKEKVEILKIQHLEEESTKEIKVDGVFICVGEVPVSILASQLGIKLNERGEVIVNSNYETNIEGIYAIGDLIPGPKQIITACGDGARAAISVYKYLKSKYK